MIDARLGKMPTTSVRRRISRFNPAPDAGACIPKTHPLEGILDTGIEDVAHGASKNPTARLGLL